MTPDVAAADESLRQLVGRSLDQLCVGVGEVQLDLSGGYALTLESTIGEERAGTPVRAPTLEGLRLLMPLLGKDVTGAGADDAGGLTVAFGDAALHCPASPDAEAWQLSGPAGVLVVSMPGGGLAVWSS